MKNYISYEEATLYLDKHDKYRKYLGETPEIIDSIIEENKIFYFLYRGELYLDREKFVEYCQDYLERENCISVEYPKDSLKYRNFCLSRLDLKIIKTGQLFAEAVLNQDIKLFTVELNILRQSFEKGSGIYDIFTPSECVMDCCGASVEVLDLGKKYVSWENIYIRDAVYSKFLNGNIAEGLLDSWRIGEEKLLQRDVDGAEVKIPMPLYFSKQQLWEAYLEAGKIGKKI